MGKFRLEHWWFGLVVLARNLGLSMAIALAVDHASLQRTIVMLLMLAYFGSPALPGRMQSLCTRTGDARFPMEGAYDQYRGCFGDMRFGAAREFGSAGFCRPKKHLMLLVQRVGLG